MKLMHYYYNNYFSAYNYFLQDHEPHGGEIVTGVSHFLTLTVVAPGNHHATPPLSPTLMVPVLRPFNITVDPIVSQILSLLNVPVKFQSS